MDLIRIKLGEEVHSCMDLLSILDSTMLRGNVYWGTC